MVSVAPPTQSASRMIKVLAALGDPTRYRIVDKLRRSSDTCVGELATELQVSASAVSQQCKLLEFTGLLERRRFGQKICYQLNWADPLVRSVVRFVYGEGGNYD